MDKIQRCVECDQPTGRCEDDTITFDGDGPFCEDCYLALIIRQEQLQGPYAGGG